MKFKHYILPAVALLASALMTNSCSDDDNDGVAKAVLASAKVLTFDGTGADPQIITVYSDAQWVADVPEWVTIDPETGSGTTEVIVKVADNLREGSLDNPRKATIVFRGNTKPSRAEVTVRQLGDNYRDGKVYAGSEIAALDDEAYVQMNGMTVTAALGGSCIATDDNGANNVMITTTADLASGDVISVKGQKYTDARGIAYVAGEFVDVTANGTEVVYPEPVDITDIIDSYTADGRQYVKVNGIVTDLALTVSETAATKISMTPAAGVNLEAVNGHEVTLYGYYAGTAAPYINLQVVGYDDHGVLEFVYYADDFEWLEPWSSLAPAGRTVETDDLDATAQQLATNKVDDVSTYAALLAKGYQFLATHAESKSERKPEAQCYLQRNYIKFGLTGYYSGITLPTLNSLPKEGYVPVASFDWCPMRQGSGTMDPTKLVLIVKNGNSEVQFEVPEHGMESGAALKWIHVEIPLEGVDFDENTRISVRNCDEQWPSPDAGALRWFIDNIKIYNQPE